MSQGRLKRYSSVADDIEDVDTWRCTDVLFLAIVLLFWAGLAIISVGAFATGDLKALEFGTDYLGNRCGQGKFADCPAVWYPRMSEYLGSQWMVLKEHPRALVMYGLCLCRNALAGRRPRSPTMAMQKGTRALKRPTGPSQCARIGSDAPNSAAAPLGRGSIRTRVHGLKK